MMILFLNSKDKLIEACLELFMKLRKEENPRLLKK